MKGYMCTATSRSSKLCDAQNRQPGRAAAVSPKKGALRICNLAFILFIHETGIRRDLFRVVFWDQRLRPQKSGFGSGNSGRISFQAIERSLVFAPLRNFWGAGLLGKDWRDAECFS